MLEVLCWMRIALVLVFGCEWIWIELLIKVTERVIDLTVLGFVGTDVKQQVTHCSMALRHVPVLDGDVWCLHLLEHWKLAAVNVRDGPRVSEDSFFFQIADEAMAGAWRDEVRDEEGVEPYTLRAEHHETHEPARLSHLEECEQMHALVVRLLEQRLDPAIVALHAAHRVQMAKHASDHARYASYRLQKDKPTGRQLFSSQRLFELTG